MLSNSNAKMTVVLMCHCAPPANNSLEASIVASLLKEVLVGAGADISDLLLLHSELAKLLILIVLLVGGRLLGSLPAPLARGAVGSLRGSRALAGLGGLGGVRSWLPGSCGRGTSNSGGFGLQLALDLAEDDAGRSGRVLSELAVLEMVACRTYSSEIRELLEVDLE
jgi:hypothetical protein